MIWYSTTRVLYIHFNCNQCCAIHCSVYLCEHLTSKKRQRVSNWTLREDNKLYAQDAPGAKCISAGTENTEEATKKMFSLDHKTKSICIQCGMCCTCLCNTWYAIIHNYHQADEKVWNCSTFLLAGLDFNSYVRAHSQNLLLFQSNTSSSLGEMMTHFKAWVYNFSRHVANHPSDLHAIYREIFILVYRHLLRFSQARAYLCLILLFEKFLVLYAPPA